MKKKVLITGANGGFGQLISMLLLQRGHLVAATVRQPNSRNKAVAENLKNAGALVIDLDVTDDVQVKNGVDQAHKALGGLDVLINNAGVGAIGLQEAFKPQDLESIFRVNVFGVQRMNRAVIPYFREQKNGLIIYTSSLLGRIAIPFYGPYNASKWALEALAENFRVEISAFGIESAIVEPGGYLNTFMDHLLQPGDRERQKAYGEFARAPETFLENYKMHLQNSPQQDPYNVALAVAGLLDMPEGTRPLRTIVDQLGMKEAIEPYNILLENITTALYTNLGLADMLTVKQHSVVA